MNAIDTNIWVYAHDLRDSRKQTISQNLIQTLQPMSLIWQVGCEFIASARKLESFGFNRDQAWTALTNMCEMVNAIVLPVPEMWLTSRHIQDAHGLSFWDSLLISSCIQGKVTTLYSKDFTHRQKINGLEIVNPFK
jgi:predicted nucleic acid-binding protein